MWYIYIRGGLIFLFVLSLLHWITFLVPLFLYAFWQAFDGCWCWTCNFFCNLYNSDKCRLWITWVVRVLRNEKYGRVFFVCICSFSLQSITNSPCILILTNVLIAYLLILAPCYIIPNTLGSVRCKHKHKRHCHTISFW